jgi:hypothetical protein
MQPHLGLLTEFRKATPPPPISSSKGSVQATPFSPLYKEVQNRQLLHLLFRVQKKYQLPLSSQEFRIGSSSLHIFSSQRSEWTLPPPHPPVLGQNIEDPFSPPLKVQNMQLLAPFTGFRLGTLKVRFRLCYPPPPPPRGSEQAPLFTSFRCFRINAPSMFRIGSPFSPPEQAPLLIPFRRFRLGILKVQKRLPLLIPSRFRAGTPSHPCLMLQIRHRQPPSHTPSQRSESANHLAPVKGFRSDTHIPSRLIPLSKIRKSHPPPFSLPLTLK